MSIEVSRLGWRPLSFRARRTQRPRLQDRFREPGFPGVGIREDIEMIAVSGLLAGVDID